MPIVLHVSPHPDDEVLGCGATLASLRDAGWRVVNLACSLGRPSDAERRAAELHAALTVLTFEGLTAPPGSPLDRVVADTAAELAPDVVVSPHPGDAHPFHAAVGRAVAEAAAAGARWSWWMWGLWADVPSPNLYLPYGEARMAELAEALRCHAGEVARNDYVDLLRARGRTQAILGSEKVFGFASAAASAAASSGPFADLLAEVPQGEGRLLDPGSGIVKTPAGSGEASASGRARKGF